MTDLIVLPDDSHYFLLSYPDPSKPYDPAASPVLERRYFRLLKSKGDVLTKGLIGGSVGDADPDSAIAEGAVEAVIDKYRAAGLNDERLVKAVFVGSYNVDDSGGYFTHNFIIAAGQEMKDGAVGTFFDQALELVG